MDSQTTKVICLACYLLLSLIINTNTSTDVDDVEDSHDRVKSSYRKLFVFGDSYADTGNSRRPTAVSWKEPYGISFPGKPAGRFSDGLVLTDFLASFLSQESPVPYKLRKSAEKPQLDYGMNFAFGGTGVFDTMEKEPNMSSQIDFFQELLEQNFFTNGDLNSSLALVSLAGNDYAAFLANKGSKINPEKDLANLTTSIVNQLVVDLKRLQSLGVRKIGVTALQPLGCMPPFTVSNSYRNCSETWNSASDFHNQMLKQSLKDLNSNVVVLDLYNAFMSAFKILQENTTGNLTLENNPMKPCCVGTCGSVDEISGAKKYSVCENPKLSFFWDTIHPSQNGWRLVFSALQPSLPKLLN